MYSRNSAKPSPATTLNCPAGVCNERGLDNAPRRTARVRDGGHLVRLRADPDQALVPGQTVHLEVDPLGWRLFDQAGEALPRPEPASPPSREPLLPALS